ncbi:MAG TPA: response regulator [Steroidobacteraceae bacterium]|nr:response regulator [Steroidobacteraceae bacterium]
MSSCPIDIPLRHAALVCIVDADPAVRQSVGALMRALGAEVASYATAREFLAGLGGTLPVCVVADNRLPDMGGVALIEELRRRGLEIPTVLLSADADVGGAVTAMRAGALDFIEKPYIDRALETVVAPILEVDDQRSH